MESGWVSYGPGTARAYSSRLDITFDAPPDGAGDALGPELADVGRLVRRGVRAVVGAARADERVTLARLLAEHLGTAPPHWMWSRRAGPGTSTSTSRPTSTRGWRTGRTG